MALLHLFLVDLIFIAQVQALSIIVVLMVLCGPVLPVLRRLWIDASGRTLDDDAFWLMADVESLSDFLYPLCAGVKAPQHFSVIQVELGKVSLVNGDEKEISVRAEPCGGDVRITVGGEKRLYGMRSHHIIAEKTVAQGVIDAVPAIVGVFCYDLCPSWQMLDNCLDAVGHRGLGHCSKAEHEG